MTIKKVVSITWATEIVTDNYSEGGQFPKTFQVLAKCPATELRHRAVRLDYTPHVDSKPDPKAPQGQSSVGKAPTYNEKKRHMPCELFA
jgi:hypothetical protein